MGLLDSVTGFFGNDAAKDRALNAIRAQKAGELQAQEIGNKYYGGLEDAYSKDASTYLTDLAGYRGELSKAPIEMGQFDQNQYDVQKYLDPSMKFQQQQMQGALDQSASARGGMFSGTGAQAKALQDRSAQLAQTDYGNAFNRMQGERQFGYQDFMNHFQSSKANEAQRMANMSGLLNQSSTGRQNMFDAQGGKANLGMGTARGLGDLEAKRQNTYGDYWKAQASNIGSGLNSIASFGGSGGFGGGGGGIDPNGQGGRLAQMQNHGMSTMGSTGGGNQAQNNDMLSKIFAMLGGGK